MYPANINITTGVGGIFDSKSPLDVYGVSWKVSECWSDLLVVARRW